MDINNNVLNLQECLFWVRLDKIICQSVITDKIFAMIAVRSRKIICGISQVLRNRENLRMNQRQLETSLEQIDAKDAPLVRVEKRGHDSMRDMFEK